VTRPRLFWTVIVLLLAGTVALAVALRAEAPVRGGAAPVPGPAPARPAAPAATPAPARPVVVVRRRGGVPDAWRARVARTDGVWAVSRASRGQALVTRTRARDGRTVSRARAGYAFPLDVLAVEPAGYARLLDDGPARAAVGRLRAGRALLSESSGRLRRIGAGGRITLTGGRTLRVAGVVPDGAVRSAELVVGRADGVRLGATRSPYLLAATTDPDPLVDRWDERDGATAASEIALTGRPEPTRGGIARPVELKRAFGEFAVRLPYGEDWIEVDPAWRARNVVTRSVPVLGAATCHRAVFAPLRRAMADLRRRGLARLVDRGDVAGCYAPRRIPGSGSLSLHAYGAAIDLNASRNPQFGKSRQDPRLVRAMERAGFTWGGRWPTAPDPMHFELHAP